MVSYLRLADHEVVEFGRIEGVEQALAARPPDLIVLDVMLPDGDGFQLARRIRRDRQVPLLFANRGFGAGRGAGAEAVPVLEKGVLLGYYRTGWMQFQADTANRRFLESLRGTFWVGASASLVIAVLAGLFFSHGLTQPAIRHSRRAGAHGPRRAIRPASRAGGLGDRPDRPLGQPPREPAGAGARWALHLGNIRYVESTRIRLQEGVPVKVRGFGFWSGRGARPVPEAEAAEAEGVSVADSEPVVVPSFHRAPAPGRPVFIIRRLLARGSDD